MQVIFDCILAKFYDQYQASTGPVIPGNHLEDICSIALTLSLSEVDYNGRVLVFAITLSDNRMTFYNQREIAHFEFLNEAEADNLTEIDPNFISLARMLNPSDFVAELSQLI